MELKKVIIAIISVTVIIAISFGAYSYLTAEKYPDFQKIKPVSHSLNQNGDFEITLKNFSGDDLILWVMILKVQGHNETVILPVDDVIQGRTQTETYFAQGLGNFNKNERYKIDVYLILSDNLLNYTNSGSISGKVI